MQSGSLHSELSHGGISLPSRKATFFDESARRHERVPHTNDLLNSQVVIELVVRALSLIFRNTSFNITETLELTAQVPRELLKTPLVWPRFGKQGRARLLACGLHIRDIIGRQSGYHVLPCAQ